MPIFAVYSVDGLPLLIDKYGIFEKILNSQINLICAFYIFSNFNKIAVDKIFSDNFFIAFRRLPNNWIVFVVNEYSQSEIFAVKLVELFVQILQILIGRRLLSNSDDNFSFKLLRSVLSPVIKHLSILRRDSLISSICRPLSSSSPQLFVNEVAQEVDCLYTMIVSEPYSCVVATENVWNLSEQMIIVLSFLTECSISIQPIYLSYKGEESLCYLHTFVINPQNTLSIISHKPQCTGAAEKTRSLIRRFTAHVIHFNFFPTNSADKHRRKLTDHLSVVKEFEVQFNVGGIWVKFFSRRIQKFSQQLTSFADLCKERQNLFTTLTQSIKCGQFYYHCYCDEVGLVVVVCGAKWTSGQIRKYSQTLYKLIES